MLVIHKYIGGRVTVVLLFVLCLHRMIFQLFN